MGAIAPTITQGLGALGGITSVARTITNAVSDIRDFQDAGKSDDLALQQLRERQALDTQQTAAEAALDKEELDLRATQDEASRRTALRRAVARQKALFGASGMDPTAVGGSAEAVLLGLTNDTQTELDDRAALDAIKARALDLNAAQRQSLNLLQATQLEQRQSLNSLF